MFDVAVVGSLHLDIMIYGSPLPRSDETVLGERWGFKCGGKGGNQAKAAARFGAATQFIGCIGRDDFGRRLRDDLAAAGVDVSAVCEDAALGSGMSVAIVDRSGSYGASVVSGANRAIAIAGLASLSARVLMLQNEIPEAVNMAAARLARDRAMCVVLNCAPWRPLADDLVRLADILVLNRVEAEQSGGLTGRSDLRLVLTCGARGVELRDRGRASHLNAHPVRQVSSHGAGDMFCGALAARLARGDDLSRAVRFANAAAALFVAREEGAPIGLEEVEALAES